jgi:glyoxylase-like metal-dependent hydrolase (beta-lactamase superfamily II)
MKWIQIPLGPIQTNCYLVYNEQKECLIFDPGEEPNRLLQFIQQKGLVPRAILLTHAHFDHIGAADALRDHYRINLYQHSLERKWLEDASFNGSIFFSPNSPMRLRVADEFIEQEGEFELHGFKFTIFHTPGHSPGSISYYFEEERIVISGDVLFKEGIGRTDLPGGDERTLLRSIHTKLLTLPEDTLVLSGHGDVTTIQDEMNNNPYLHAFFEEK